MFSLLDYLTEESFKSLQANLKHPETPAWLFKELSLVTWQTVVVWVLTNSSLKISGNFLQAWQLSQKQGSGIKWQWIVCCECKSYLEWSNINTWVMTDVILFILSNKKGLGVHVAAYLLALSPHHSNRSLCLTSSTFCADTLVSSHSLKSWKWMEDFILTVVCVCVCVCVFVSVKDNMSKTFPCLLPIVNMKNPCDPDWVGKENKQPLSSALQNKTFLMCYLI